MGAYTLEKADAAKTIMGEMNSIDQQRDPINKWFFDQQTEHALDHLDQFVSLSDSDQFDDDQKASFARKRTMPKTESPAQKNRRKKKSKPVAQEVPQEQKQQQDTKQQEPEKQESRRQQLQRKAAEKRAKQRGRSEDAERNGEETV